MNKNIKLITQWSDEDDCFVTTSEAYDRVIGIGDTPHESEKVFYEILEEYLIDESAGKIAVSKGGRPFKDNARLNCNISKEARAYIDGYCDNNNLNPGKFIELLVDYFKKDHPATN